MVKTMSATSLSNQSVSVESLVDRLFQRFAAMYGSIWLDRWADVPMDYVKETWCADLRGMTSEQFRLALDHVKLHCSLPPTLPEFVRLCRQFAPAKTAPQLVPQSRGPIPPHVKTVLDAFIAKHKV